MFVRRSHSRPRLSIVLCWPTTLPARWKFAPSATTPGSRPTIKCRMCKLWSHSDCVGNLKKHFTCRLCHSSSKDPLDATDVLDAAKNTSADHPKLAAVPL
ncbi:hypothetical protein C8J57DRAFT_1282007, partial [Mycena rebaudengoi]